MAVILPLYEESTLTDRYQTTVPDAIRKALRLNKRDKICYTIQSDGMVTISRSEPMESDPILGEFLNFLARDIKDNPGCLQTFSPDSVSRVQSLVAEVDFDIDTQLSDEDE